MSVSIDLHSATNDVKMYTKTLSVRLNKMLSNVSSVVSNSLQSPKKKKKTNKKKISLKLFRIIPNERYRSISKARCEIHGMGSVLWTQLTDELSRSLRRNLRSNSSTTTTTTTTTTIVWWNGNDVNGNDSNDDDGSGSRWLLRWVHIVRGNGVRRG